MEYKKTINGKNIMMVLILLVLCLSIFNFMKMVGYKKVCIAQECTEWAYGDDWVKDNCHLNNESKYDYCPMTIDGNDYNVALHSINISQMKSCRKTVCAVNIYVKYGGKK